MDTCIFFGGGACYIWKLTSQPCSSVETFSHDVFCCLSGSETRRTWVFFRTLSRNAASTTPSETSDTNETSKQERKYRTSLNRRLINAASLFFLTAPDNVTLETDAGGVIPVFGFSQRPLGSTPQLRAEKRRSVLSMCSAQGKNSAVIETANTSLPLAQLSCFRGGFKACHKTSCIVNSAASMADW